LVVLVVVMAGSGMVALCPGGAVPSQSLSAPFTAAGRKLAMSVGAAMLLQHYHLHEAQAPLVMAGAFPKRSPVTYVVAALVDEPVAGIVTCLASADTLLADVSMREHLALAVASVQRLMGMSGAEAVALPPGCLLGHDVPAAVAVDPEVSDESVQLFEARRDADADHCDRARRALDVEMRHQTANGDTDLAQYLHEVYLGMGQSPFDDIPTAVAGTSIPTEELSI
jgi:hypothetical protein